MIGATGDNSGLEANCAARAVDAAEEVAGGVVGVKGSSNTGLDG